MFEHILDCPQCKKRFHYEYDGEKYPEQIHCPECGTDSPYGDYYALILCSGCRGKLKIPLDVLHEEGNSCPRCGMMIQPDRIGTDNVESTYTISESVSRKQSKRMLEDGAFFDKFKIIKLLGRGGMAEVYLAEHLLLKQLCALKLMQKSLDQANDPVFIKRFVREAKLTHSLNHPNIVRVFDAGSDFKTGYLFLAMEYVEGKTLHAIINERSLSETELLEVLRVIGNALKTLEAAKVVHRDIKPSNIMYTNDGVYKLMDLGIAKVESNHQAGDMTLTMEKSTIGTPGYASPEQCQTAHQVDIRSDIYSLGATLYHAASGVLPFTGDTPVAVILKVMQGDFKPLRKHRSDLSDGFIELVEKMMAKNPEDRFQSVDELLAEAANIKVGQSLPVPVRKVKTAVTSWATTFFFRKKEAKKKSLLSKIGLAFVKLFLALFLIGAAVLHVYYVMLNKDSHQVDYKDFLKTIWRTTTAQSTPPVEKTEKEALQEFLNKMHPLVLDPDKNLQPITRYRAGKAEKAYPVVSVSCKDFKTYSFDAEHKDFTNLFQDMLHDGLLDLGSDGARLLGKNPELLTIQRDRNKRATYVVNFLRNGENDKSLFRIEVMAHHLDVFLNNGQLRLVLNNQYQAYTGIQIPPNRWVNLVISLDSDERKITLLSENRLLGTWLFPETRKSTFSTVPFKFSTAILKQNFGGKVDFLAVSDEPVQIRPTQPARYEAFQTHWERLPDKLPEEVQKTLAAPAQNTVPAKPKNSTAPAETAKNITPAAPIQPEVVQQTSSHKSQGYFPVWRDLKMAKVFNKLQAVDTHYAALVVEYRKYRQDVELLQQSLQKKPDSVPVSIWQERLELAQKAKQLCIERENRLKYLKTRNEEINKVKVQIYSNPEEEKIRREFLDRSYKARNYPPYVKMPDPQFAETLFEWLSDENNDPNIEVVDVTQGNQAVPIIKTLCRSRFITRADTPRLFDTLLKRHADLVLEPEDIRFGSHLGTRLASYGVRGKLLGLLFDDYCQAGNLNALLPLFADGALPEKEHLFRAVQRSRYDLVLFLLACGADPNWRNERGETALFYAYSYAENIKIRNLLLASGADPGIISNEGKRASDFELPANFVTNWNNGNIVKIREALSSGQVSANTFLPDGHTLLTSACMKGDEELVTLLLQHGADPKQIDAFDWSPIWALDKNLTKVNSLRARLNICKNLLQLGGDFRTPKVVERNSLMSILVRFLINPEANLVIETLAPFLKKLSDDQWIMLLSQRSTGLYLSRESSQLLWDACPRDIYRNYFGAIANNYALTPQMLQKAFDEGVSPNSRVSVYGAGKGPLLLAMLLSRKQEKDVIETALKAGADPNLLSGVEKARLSEYNIGAGPAKGSRTWPAASEKTNPRDFQGTVRPTVRPVVEPQPGNITTIQIKVGVNQRFSLFLKQQSLILQSPIKSLSITPDLKKYQGFYYRTPTCLISTKQRLIKWDLRTPFVVDKGKDNLYIVDVRILASSRPIITVHPKQDKSIQPRNVSLRWTENSINLTDNEIGAAAFIIELSFSNQKPDLTKKTSYVSKHKLITN